MIYHFIVERAFTLIWNMAAIILLDLNDWIARWTVLVTNSFSFTSSTLFSQDQAIFLCNELYLLSSGLEIKRSKASPKSSFSIWYHDVFCCYIHWSMFSKLYKGEMQKWMKLQSNFIYRGKHSIDFELFRGWFSSSWVIKFFASNAFVWLIASWSVWC